jgi:hypothetical protein
MGALTALHRQELPLHGMLWLCPEEDPESVLMVRAERLSGALILRVPTHTRLVEVAARGGRVRVMSAAAEIWLEQPFTASLLDERGGECRLMLRAAGPPLLLEEVAGPVPRT